MVLKNARTLDTQKCAQTWDSEIGLRNGTQKCAQRWYPKCAQRWYPKFGVMSTKESSPTNRRCRKKVSPSEKHCRHADQHNKNTNKNSKLTIIMEEFSFSLRGRYTNANGGVYAKTVCCYDGVHNIMFVLRCCCVVVGTRMGFFIVVQSVIP